jgi:hypothetical protein
MLRGLRVVNARLSTLCAKGCARGDPGPLTVLMRLEDYLFTRFLLGPALGFFVAVGAEESAKYFRESLIKV